MSKHTIELTLEDIPAETSEAHEAHGSPAGALEAHVDPKTGNVAPNGEPANAASSDSENPSKVE